MLPVIGAAAGSSAEASGEVLMFATLVVISAISSAASFMCR
jgi:hypothetical protein